MDQALEETERILQSTEEVLDNLLILLKEENQAIEVRDMLTIQKIVPKKDRLSQIYEAQIRRLAQEEELADFLNEAHRKRLTEKATQLEPLIEENAALLRRMISASEIIQEIFKSVSQNIQTTFQTYGSNGVNQKTTFTQKVPLSMSRDV